MAARRKPGWADVPTMPPPPPEQVELLGLSVIVTVLERMSPTERTRSLKWLLDRYAPTVRLGDEGGD